MTKPPCRNDETLEDCPKRRVGCRAECEQWKQFEKIHAEELEHIRQKRREFDMVESFLSGQNKRIEMQRHRENAKKHRGK